MQSFGAFFNDNRQFEIPLIVVAVVVSAAILIFLYRLLFGRRLHMAGTSRTRQPRLGVVDAFDLDRQRQLVLVRRDNVEHLIMIGGPNDIVIESAFVRMQPTASLPLGREKDAGLGPTAPMAPMAGAVPVPAPTLEATSPTVVAAAPVIAVPDRHRALPPLDLGEPIDMGHSDPLVGIPAPAPVAAAAVPVPPPPPPPPEAFEPPAPPPPAELSAPAPDAVPAPVQAEDPVVPEPSVPPAPASPRPVPMPSRFSTGLPPRPFTTAPRPPLPARTPTQVSAMPQRTPSLGPRPMPSSPLSRGTSAASLRRDPPSTAPPAGSFAPAESAVKDIREAAPSEIVETPAPGTVEGSLAPSVEPSTPSPGKLAPTLPTTLDTLESLEEEMARLLGRPPAGPDRP